MIKRPDLNDHPWWHYVPPSRRRYVMTASSLRQLGLTLKRRPVVIGVITMVSLLISLIPIVFGVSELTLIAITPILLFPILLGLIWWLTWKEFHD